MRILGLGLAVPERHLDQETFAVWAQEISRLKGKGQRVIPSVYLRSGVKKRHSVVLKGDPIRQDFFPPASDADDEGPTTAARMRMYDAMAGPLAVRAARDALGETRAVTHLVTVSCTGFRAPGFDLELVRRLELPRDVARTHVGFMGCHGALNGLRVAHAFVRDDPAARVLLCAVELCTLHYQYGVHPERIVANGLFADGAAALLLAHDDGTTPWRLVANGSTVLPDSAACMDWTIGDHGFLMGLAAEVPQRIRDGLAPWLDGWLAPHGLARKDVGSWAIHPGGPRILSAAEAALELLPDATADARAVLAEYGNMSSATVLFLLDRLRRRNATRPCVALGFGPGLAVEAALFV